MPVRQLERKKPLPPIGDPNDPTSMFVWMVRYLRAIEVRGYSVSTIRTSENAIRAFISWAAERSITKPSEVTKPILERYQRWVFYLRKKDGSPLRAQDQRTRLSRLRLFFKWLIRNDAILANPASELELPRREQMLPKDFLSEVEVEKVLALPDLTDPIGVRNRAMMETLYSTGVRRFELAGLSVFDLDRERGTLLIRLGKGKKDRVVPIGVRAVTWIDKYLNEVRPMFVILPDDGTLFLTEGGTPLTLDGLSMVMHRYIAASGTGKKGACHIFRHTMATLMLENGADVRHLQEILGHINLNTTVVYTHVSIAKLKQVHDRTHPGAHLGRSSRSKEPIEVKPEASPEDLLRALKEEAHDEEGTADAVDGSGAVDDPQEGS